MRIFLFGDSITQGLWDGQGGWADRIKAYVQRASSASGFTQYHEAFNLGVDGDMTSGLLERFVAETKARLWADEPLGFIFAIGVNDTLYRADGWEVSSPDEYKANLEHLFAQAMQFSGTVAFVDLLPVDEVFTKPLKASMTGKCYTNERIDQFNAVLHEFCASKKAPIVTVNEHFKRRQYTGLLSDGIHPNTEGHTIVYEALLPLIDRWLA